MPPHKITGLAELSLRQLRDRRRRVARQIPDLAAVIAGSLQSQRRRCGKEGCRCARGELHGPYVYLSLGRGRAESRLVYVPSTLADEVRRRVALTAAAGGALAATSSIHLGVLPRPARA